MTAARRTAYILATALSFVVYMLHRQWLSWLVLVALVALPVVSLLLSLPAMMTVSAKLRYPTQVRMGMPAKVSLVTRCRFPVSRIECRLRLYNSLSDERFVGTPGEYIPTDHCGKMTITCDRLRVWDALGLFYKNLPISQGEPVYILPKPMDGPLPEGVGDKKTGLWVPKPGGGFSENHELRLYRPGDDLRNIHWKLSAKTGNLIFREPMEPAQKAVRLAVTLSGSPEELDRKLGRLCQVSDRLLGENRSHRVFLCSGEGEKMLEIKDLPSREDAMRLILGSTPTVGEWLPEDGEESCLIGGDFDET